MPDMMASIEPKSDQMNYEDLKIGGPRTFTIERVVVRPGSDDQPVSVYLKEFPSGRPFKPAKTVRKLMVLAWGNESDDYVGKRMTLWGDPDVTWAGKKIGGIRISHMSGIPAKGLSAALSETRGKRVPYEIQHLPDDGPLPAKVPGPLDQLVWAMNAAKIGKDDRLDYCRNIVQHELGSAADLTPDEMATVVESLQEAIAYEREQGNQDG